MDSGLQIWTHIFNLQKNLLCINYIFDIFCIFFQELFVKPKSIKYPVWLSFLFAFYLQDIGNHSGEKSTAVENRLKFKNLKLTKDKKQRQMTNGAKKIQMHNKPSNQIPRNIN